MPNYSLGEIDALAKKATRGAGYSWGIAEEAGKAVRWLSAYGFSGAEALAQHLLIAAEKKGDLVPKLNNKNSEKLVFDSNANNYAKDDNNDGSVCSLYSGTLISDLGHHINANKALEFSNMSYPILALSAAGRIAEAYNISVSFTYNQTTIILDSKGIVLNDSSAERSRSTPPLLDSFYLVNQADVVCRRIESDVSNTHFPSPQSRLLAEETLKVLGKFAQTTYAPATEESRLRGAGEG